MYKSLNIGDSYAGSGKGGNPGDSKQTTNVGSQFASHYSKPGDSQRNNAVTNVTRKVVGQAIYKAKDLVGIPWMLAFALRADGWFLRQDIIWAKPNPMPESVADRYTKAHEYIFMLSKSSRYNYDQDAIKEPAIYFGLSGQDDSGYKDAQAYSRKHKKSDKQRGHSRRHAGFNERWDAMTRNEQCSGMRNKRSVWEIPTSPFPEAHFATFPPDLVRPCILAGCPAMGMVIDPFSGAGTTLLVARENGCRAIGIELNKDYISIAVKRLAQTVFEFPAAEPEAEQMEIANA